MTNDYLIGKKPQKAAVAFHVRFWRCYRLLHFIACRILGSPKQADDAVENWWLTASRNPPQFEYDGEFRIWLLRVLIDEALAILQQGFKSGPRNDIPQQTLYRRAPQELRSRHCTS